MSRENNRPRLVGVALAGAPLKVMVKTNLDNAMGRCSRCNGMGYQSDIRQFGCCLDCTERILGERPMVLREFAHMMDEPDDDLLTDDALPTDLAIDSRINRVNERDVEIYEAPGQEKGKSDE